MAAVTPALAADPGRPSTAVLGARFMKSELQMLLNRLLRAAGLRKLHDALPQDWAIPDSQFAVQAIEHARALCPPYMIDHSFRAYSFGAILAARNKLKLDREVFFVAAMLHDLGLSDQHVNDPGSFEWVGARLAYDFVRKDQQANDEQSEWVAATVHNAIALHTSVGIVGGEVPEIALLHYGTGMDLFGMRLDEIPADALHELLTRYPRTDFKATFGQCLQHQADTKPASQIAAAVGIGICDRILPELKG